MNALYQYISQNATSANQLEYIKLHNEIYALLYPESISEIDSILKGNAEKIDVKEDLSSAVKTIYNSWIGEDYSETKVDVNIPKGGYIQITDDPDEIVIIQSAKDVEEIVVDEVKDVIKDTIVDEIKKATGIGKIGKHDTDAVKWGGKVIGTAVKGYKALKKSAEISDRLGNIYWSSKEKGTGSLIIYNS